MKEVSHTPSVAKGRKICPLRNLVLLLVAAGVCSSGAPPSVAQGLDSIPWPGSPPAFLDVFLGWDISELTDEEQASFWCAVDPAGPVAQSRIARNMTRSQTESRNDAALAITRPDEYARRHPVKKSEAEIAEEEFHRWAIMHPVEYGLWLKQNRGNAGHRPILEDPLTRSEAAHGQGKGQPKDRTRLQAGPKAIIATVPYEEAGATLEQLNEGR